MSDTRPKPGDWMKAAYRESREESDQHLRLRALELAVGVGTELELEDPPVTGEAAKVGAGIALVAERFLAFLRGDPKPQNLAWKLALAQAEAADLRRRCEWAAGELRGILGPAGTYNLTQIAAVLRGEQPVPEPQQAAKEQP